MRKREMVELRFRLPAEGWKDLTALLAAALGAAAPAQEVQQRGEENPAFDEAVFRRMEAMEEAPAPKGYEPGEDVRTYRGEGRVDMPLSAPVPAAYRAMEAEKTAGEEQRETNWEQRWERDCRRYDSGFPLR